jgi:branched-chain amino acid aminotransferase
MRRRAGSGIIRSMPSEPGHVWVDGRLLLAAGPHLSAFDRGFQLGDGVFETLRARAGQPAELNEHILRLRRSADGLAIELPADLDGRLAAAIADLLAAEKLAGPDGDASVRITVSRGAIPQRGLLPPATGVPATIVVQAWAIVPAPSAQLERGLHIVASSVRRNVEDPLAGLKTTSRADFVFARLEARRADADDALFLTTDGYLAEATSANVFLVRRGELATPTLACAVLPGTTRDWLLRWATTVGLVATETWLTTRELLEADEAFISSSVAGVLPVTRFEGHAVGTGRPGRWTLRARADREAFLRGPQP